jgi:iron complex outermembrane recepter protein
VTTQAHALLAVTGLFAAAPFVARGQAGSTASEADSPALEELVVTADRRNSFGADLVQAGSFRGARQLDTPLTVNVIPDALLRSQQAQSLLDALRNTAGVTPSQISTTTYSNIAIRGINVENRGNYRLNGSLPIVNLVDLPLENKDRVEVLKGASALYYGFTTPAGIVNLTTKRPTAELHLAATLLGNEHGSVLAHVDASDTFGLFGVRVNAVHGRVDSGIDQTRGRRSLFAAALDFRASDDVMVTLDAEHIEKRVNEPGVFRYLRLPAATLADLYPALELPPLLDASANFGPDWALNSAEERNVLAGVSWKMAPAWELTASYGTSRIVRQRHFNTIDLDDYGAGTNGDGTLSVGLQPGSTFANANYRVEVAGAARSWFMQHELLGGVSRNVRDGFTSATVPVRCPGATPTAPRVPCRQNIFAPVAVPETPFGTPTGVRARIDDAGYYLFDRIELTQRLQVLVGIRKADYTETNRDTRAITFADDPTSLSYGAIVRPRPWLRVYGTYIEGLESTPAAPATAANFDATLPATESRQREAGIKIELKPGLLLMLAHFDIERGSAFVNGENVYVLDGRARFRGAELSVTGEVTPAWSLYATAQALDAKQISGAATVVRVNPTTGAVTVVPTTVGRAIENTPERTFSLATEHRLPRLLPGLSVNGAVYHISKAAVNAFNQAFIPGYTLLDLGAAYRGEFRGNELTFRLTAQNVAGKEYFSSTGGNVISQAPPRTLKFSVTTRL